MKNRKTHPPVCLSHNLSFINYLPNLSLMVPVTHVPPSVIVSLVQWHIFYFSSMIEHICKQEGKLNVSINCLHISYYLSRSQGHFLLPAMAIQANNFLPGERGTVPSFLST